MGRDKIGPPASSKLFKFQPTLPVWGETQRQADRMQGKWISTHSPRVGRDTIRRGKPVMKLQISTHSPRVGRDVQRQADRTKANGFQPTLPVWGETIQFIYLRFRGYNFNPLSPCGERRGKHVSEVFSQSISTHSPRVGRDTYTDHTIYLTL